MPGVALAPDALRTRRAPGRSARPGIASARSPSRCRGGRGREAVDDEPEQQRRRSALRSKRPDDPAPEAVGQPDREVPEGEAHHGPREIAISGPVGRVDAPVSAPSSAAPPVTAVAGAAAWPAAWARSEPCRRSRRRRARGVTSSARSPPPSGRCDGFWAGVRSAGAPLPARLGFGAGLAGRGRLTASHRRARARLGPVGAGASSSSVRARRLVNVDVWSARSRS